MEWLSSDLLSLLMQFAHPADRLLIAYLAQINLGDPQILVSQDDLGDDFQGHTTSAGIGGCMSPEIMGPDPNSLSFAAPHDNGSGSVVREWKDPLVGLELLFADVRVQPLCDPFG